MAATAAPKKPKKSAGKGGSLLAALTMTLDRKAFAETLAVVAGVIPARSPKPILQEVLLVADPDRGTELIGTDLEIGIRRKVLGVNCPEAIEAVLPARRLGEILRNATDTEVAIAWEPDGEAVRIRGDRWEFTLPTQERSLYPEVPDFEAEAFHVVAARDWAKLVRRTIYCADTESVKYALGGCLLEWGDEHLSLTGTDGRRLAHQKVPAETEQGGIATPGKPVVPAKALKVAARLVAPDDAPVHIALHGEGCSAVVIRTETAVLYSRLVEGRFPRYEDVFPKETVATRCMVEAEILESLLARAMIATSEDSRGVDVVLAKDRVKATAQAADVGRAEVEIEATIQGPKAEITIDPRYFLDVCRSVDAATVLKVEIIDGKNAIVIRTDDEMVCAVMPLTRDR